MYPSISMGARCGGPPPVMFGGGGDDDDDDHVAGDLETFHRMPPTAI